MLLAWHVVPVPTLAAFLAASVWHFGLEDAESGTPFEAAVRGGMPIAIPVLVHPTATSAVFTAISGTSLSQPPEWLWVTSLV